MNDSKSREKRIGHSRGVDEDAKLTLKCRRVNGISHVFPRKTFLSIVPAFALIHIVQAHFWNFYLPNELKPAGYKELSMKMSNLRQKINVIKDTNADIIYFWDQLEQVDRISPDEVYPEESACSDLFPMFRALAREYSQIDYEMYLAPFEEYATLLENSRSEWFPSGVESKANLPREWEQNLYEKEMEFKIKWHTKLTEEPEYRQKRQKMLDIWKRAKRGLDSSLPCLYLRYAYRQVAEDINQLALETNLRGMHRAVEMIKSAYKRIEKFQKSDLKAKDAVAKEIEKEKRFELNE